MKIKWRVADCWICKHAGKYSLWDYHHPGCYHSGPIWLRNPRRCREDGDYMGISGKVWL